MARYYNGERYIGCEKPITIHDDETPNFGVPVKITKFPNRVTRTDFLRQSIDTYLQEVKTGLVGASVNDAPDYVIEGYKMLEKFLNI
jgi:hypothetical protein